MIETVTAANGSSVLRDEGRWLASSVNPQAEGMDWVTRRKEFLDKVKVVFVLGAGSGYHISALADATRANIVVIDLRLAVVEAVRAIHVFDSRQVKFVSFETVRALRASEEVRQGISRSFVILQHAPSVAFDPKLYREFQAQLLGRDWGTLQWQWRLKGLAALESQPKLQRPGAALTILDLEQTELVQDSQERERMLVKALRELVK